MKLISKTTLYFVIISIPVLIGAGLLTYHLINDAIEENTRELLWSEKTKAERLINNSNIENDVYLSLDSLSSIKMDATAHTGFKYVDRFKMDASENEMVQYKALISYYKKGNHNYKISISRPAIEQEDLAENLIKALLILISVLLLALITVNYILSKKLWKPFNETLHSLKQFDLTSNVNFNPPSTGTTEFKLLNKELEALTEKVKSDFKLQKEFTENASHEMQTPLAVMQTKIEQLLQSPNLSKNDLELLAGIETSIIKLSSLNKTLLMLAKIENKQFNDKEKINLALGIRNVLLLLQDFIEGKNLQILTDIAENTEIEMHPKLFDMLFTNLVQNAIKHNVMDGKIIIEAKPGYFRISNTGKNASLDAGRLFNRFYKGDTSTESTGLGLAIVKSIATNCNFKTNYNYTNNLHNFEIEF